MGFVDTTVVIFSAPLASYTTLGTIVLVLALIAKLGPRIIKFFK